MIKLEKTTTYGWEEAIRGMRNPLNSWRRSDSDIHLSGELGVGPNDLKLMKSLAKAGTSHSKFRRMITVYVDITAPLYWWKEFDTYKVGTVANSCSTMHKIAEKEFTLDDFSHEHLYTEEHELLEDIISTLNGWREMFIDSKKKLDWWQMIQLLPSSYNQKRTVMMNYEVVAAICNQRYGHKLDEWHDFIEWAHKLPLAKEIIFCEDGDHHDD